MVSKTILNAAEKIESKYRKMDDFLRGTTKKINTAHLTHAQVEVIAKAHRFDIDGRTDIEIAETALNKKVNII